MSYKNQFFVAMRNLFLEILAALIGLVTLIISFQVTALSNVEAKKRFEFLEAVSGTMDAHLRYFKQVNLTAVIMCLSHTFNHNCVNIEQL